jgi:hypothetical protein
MREEPDSDYEKRSIWWRAQNVGSDDFNLANSVALLLAATIYRGKHDSNHKRNGSPMKYSIFLRIVKTIINGTRTLS